jgi:ribosomal protein S17
VRHRRHGAVMETRPLSKSKRWRLVEIIEKAK